MSKLAEDDHTCKERFYMQMCHHLLNKFCNNHAKIPMTEVAAADDKIISVKYRINKEDPNCDYLEIMSTVEEQ